MEETVALQFSHSKLPPYLMRISHTVTWFPGIFVHLGISPMNGFPRSIEKDSGYNEEFWGFAEGRSVKFLVIFPSSGRSLDAVL